MSEKSGVICPRCLVGAQVLSKDGKDIDACSRCGGIWIDAGELGEPCLEKAITGKVDRKPDSAIRCPRCHSDMDAVRMEDVDVDVCMKCHGIWLDRGEMGNLGECDDHWDFPILHKVLKRLGR